MTKEHVRMALNTISTSKARSLMTMFGIIISVASVVTIVGLGHGLRNQVSKQITKLGGNLIIVQPGKRGSAEAVNLQSLQSIGSTSSGVLTEQDLDSTTKIKEVDLLSPVATITGLPSYEGRNMENAIIVGASESLPEIVDKKIEYGSNFAHADLSKNYAVIDRKAHV